MAPINEGNIVTNGHDASLMPEVGAKHERKSRETHWESYGCFNNYPSSLDFLASGRFFLLFMCMLIFSDAFNIGTLGGALTSLETRYELKASQLGLIESLYEAGNLIFVLFIVHYAGRQDNRRPLWIGIGALTMAIGTAIAFSPQFLFSAYNPDWKSGLTNQTAEPLTCLSDWTVESGFDQCGGEGQDNLRRENRLAYVIILCGEILVGVGWTPVMPLALSYIDDNVNTKSSAMFIGIIQSMFGVGTIFGFLTSAAVAQKWVDFYRAEVDENKMTPKNTLWVGAWWLGVAITSSMYFISSLPFFGFPRRLPGARKLDDSKNYFMLKRSESRVDDPEGDAPEDAKVVAEDTSSAKSFSLFALPASVWGLLSNPIYMFINISSFSEMAIIAGIVTFFPKYLETQFGLSPPQANFYMAVVPVPAVAIGSLLGGYLVKKLNLNAEGATKLALGCSVIALVGQIALLGIGCDSAGIGGVDTPYHNSRVPEFTDVKITSACNANCGCSSTDPEVVCGTDGITYFSACYAGCQDSLNGTFFNCSCVQGPDGVAGGSVQSGACPMDCHMLAPFLVIMFVIALVSSSEEIPQTMVTMRCVKKSDKSLSLGLRHVFTRVFGNIPAPLYYGAAIDATCRLWQMFCGVRGECWAYNLPDFRFAYMGVTVALKTVSAFSYVVTLVLLRRRTLKVPKGTSELEDGD
ncbi:solute carrier organic anion transporter family member 5A1-like [Asterias rubens]|uniref:solute carrier organic anion transporter family member 5A1-like n=1 Tax=Asterias rubens TaxID=7604 RepID=UPI0014554FCB|nr:solute carrier organic anion transporter family member 5A1-like [Asterias rubens]XP_033645877.1 solute carrier organic anion transporter family member 5A1-like [Asterias rubens]